MRFAEDETIKRIKKSYAMMLLKKRRREFLRS